MPGLSRLFPLALLLAACNPQAGLEVFTTDGLTISGWTDAFGTSMSSPDSAAPPDDLGDRNDPNVDHDMDGYTPAQGDCKDFDPLINPGAFEVIGNNVDDNCNGMIDEAFVPCDGDDSKLKKINFAGAIELCAPWIDSATGALINKDADVSSYAILPDFGLHYKPRAGKTMIYLSTGIAADENTPGYISPQPGTAFANTDPNLLPLKTRNVCTAVTSMAPSMVNDQVALTLTIKVPTNAFSFSFDFNFFSSEYPEFTGGQYNDQFLAILNSKTSKNQNVSFDLAGDPITVDSGFLRVCTSSPICATGSHTCALECDPAVIAQQHLPPCELDGTGYEVIDNHNEMIGGATGWLTSTAPVTPGETITLTFVIFDAGDHVWDSGVLIDNFRWGTDPATMGTGPSM